MFPSEGNINTELNNYETKIIHRRYYTCINVLLGVYLELKFLVTPIVGVTMDGES